MTTKDQYMQTLENLKKSKQEIKLDRKEEVDHNENLLKASKEIVELTEKELKEKMEKKEPEVKKEEDFEDDRIAYDSLGNKIRLIHNNVKRRKSLESRSTKISIEDLLINNFVKQQVTLIPNKLVVEYRSLSGDDISFISSRLWDKQMSNMHRGIMQSLYSLTASIERLNDDRFPECRKNGEIDDQMFQDKLKRIKKLPYDFLSDLIVNYIWFSERVQELSVDPENIINF